MTAARRFVHDWLFPLTIATLAGLATLALLAPYAAAQVAEGTLTYVPPAEHGVTLHDVGDIAATVGFFCALLANFVGSDSAAGKVIHWFALNGTKLQQGVSKKPPAL